MHKRDFSRVRGPPKSLIQVQIEYCLKPRLPSPHLLSGGPPKGSHQRGGLGTLPGGLLGNNPPTPLLPPKRGEGLATLAYKHASITQGLWPGIWYKYWYKYKYKYKYKYYNNNNNNNNNNNYYYYYYYYNYYNYYNNNFIYSQREYKG